MRQRKNAELRKPEILEHFYQVIIQQGLESASIAKIAESMGIHPSLIFHYFKTKDAMILALAEYLREKYDPPFIRDQFVSIKDPQHRFNMFFNIMFSETNVKTVNTSVFYAFYYLSYRNPEIHNRFADMFKEHRDFIVQELEFFKKEGLIKKDIDLELAADFIVSIFEGLAFHVDFLAAGKPFEVFGQFAKKITMDFLKK